MTLIKRVLEEVQKNQLQKLEEQNQYNKLITEIRELFTYFKGKVQIEELTLHSDLIFRAKSPCGSFQLSCNKTGFVFSTPNLASGLAYKSDRYDNLRDLIVTSLASLLYGESCDDASKTVQAVTQTD